MHGAVMFQGTGSDVGKSVLVAGLCRALHRRGIAVRPFKPQNMSNNAAVAREGGEIGRAQALQARACGVEAGVHMNPVLIKPHSETDAQVIVQGLVWANVAARDYQSRKAMLMDAVGESFRRMQSEADIVVVEGAGSPAEINLRANDIANMGFACKFGVPVVLIGDIDRGGVIASVVGTHTVLDDADRAMIRGFVVNKFRGDISLFDGGLREIVERTRWPSFGVLPYLHGLALPAEDAVETKGRAGAGVKVVVPIYPHASNTDEFDPLQLDPGVDLVFVRGGAPLPRDADLVVLPGSKATISDLRFLKAQGWDRDIAAHLRHGRPVLGLCGGYQMLGRRISDPDAIEGSLLEEPGLGLLDIETVFSGAKVRKQVDGRSIADNTPFYGYEIHVGRTHGRGLERALLRFADGRVDGAVSADGLVRGCYVHGLFGDDAQRARWIEWAGGKASDLVYETQVEDSLDRLAGAMEAHLDIEAMIALARSAK